MKSGLFSINSSKVHSEVNRVTAQHSKSSLVVVGRTQEPTKAGTGEQKPYHT